MSFVDSIPLNKGNRFRLDETKPIVIIGRNRDIGCDDQRVSRQHTEISLKSDGTVSIKGIHLNPTFYKSKTTQIVRLTKDKEYFLSNDDEFGFLPDEYFFRISIETIPKREEPTTASRETEETTNNNNNTSAHVESKKTNSIFDDDTDDEVEAKPSKEAKKRERCPFGSKCYRTNPIHRQDAIHPGDPDWQDEIEVKNKTVCPYGEKCFRKNVEHLRDFEHPRKRTIELKTKTRSGKRKTTDDEEEEEDALPNEYDYNDSFIDDEDDSLRVEHEEIESDGDVEWKPEKLRRKFDATDDSSSADSELELAKKEAEEFLQSSKKRKKPRGETSSDDE